MPERRRDGLSRRGFLQAAAAATAGAAFAPGTSSAASGLEVGYAAITWNGQDDQAIDDIASLGFHAIQLRTSG